MGAIGGAAVLTPRRGCGYRGRSLCVHTAAGDPTRQATRLMRRDDLLGDRHQADCRTDHISDTKRRLTTVRTYTPRPGDIERNWYVIDATDVVLGRLASHVAILLRGKHKATFAPHVDGGDFVIVINAAKVALTGNKREQKLAYRHSGYPGGLRAVTYGDLLATRPERAVEKAVRGMLPKNSLSNTQMSKLKVYAGAEHPHAAQQPQPFEITQVAQ